MMNFDTVKKIVYNRIVEIQQDSCIDPSSFDKFKNCIDYNDLIDLLVEYGFNFMEASEFVFKSIVDMKS